MKVGVPKEIKQGEFRVGLSPNSVRELVSQGHQVLVQTQAAEGIGITDDMYRAIGAKILNTAEEIFTAADMIVKVKEPQPSEYKLLREGQILFTYLHLAPDPDQTKALIASGCIAIAYETVTDHTGHLPLLAPMSEIAGRIAIQQGVHCLEKAQGGAGILLGGIPGVSRGHAVIIGGGFVGTNAIQMAIGQDAHVTVLDKSIKRLRELDIQFGSRLNTIFSTQGMIEKYVCDADLVVGAVLIPGAAAPKIVTRKMVSEMRPGSVIVDVAIDQGGCCETSHVTTHAEPTYIIDGVVHYCVANMPSAAPRTATFALNNATLPYVLELANKGYKKALMDDANFMNGLNVYRGHVTYEPVAIELGFNYRAAKEVLN